MVRARLNESDCDKGFILDGYPRNLNQAKELDNILADKNEKVDMVVNLNTPSEEIIERVLARRECPNCKETKPVIDFYRERGIVKDEEISISINRLGVDAAKDIAEYIKNNF